MNEDPGLSSLWDDVLKDHEAGTPLGEVALFRGYVTPDHLEECLHEQARLQKEGTPRPIGEILFSKGYLSQEQFGEVLRIKRLRVHYCHACHEIYDSSKHTSRVTVRCKKCGEDAESLGDSELPVTNMDVEVVGGGELPKGSEMGKYRLLGKIGEGGMGIIYEAKDPDLERTVALKLFKGGEKNKTGISRLHREAALASRLRHPNIIAVHEVATCTLKSGEPMHYISMDYIEGDTLSRYLKKKRNEPLREKLMLLETISRAVHYAHTKGVIHRDLKPENVLVDKKGNPVVMDFGLAKSTEGLATLTVSGAVMGTPMYMAPEQAGGKTREISPRTDVYALGVMMYEIITSGRMPFDAETPAEIYRKILDDDPPHPRRYRKNIHPDLGTICMKALEKKEGCRYRSAEDFADDLQHFLAGEAIKARSPGLVTRIARKVVKRKQVVIVGAVGFLLVAGLAGFLVPKLFEQRSKTAEEERLRKEAEEARLVLLREKTSEQLNFMLQIRRLGGTEGLEIYESRVKEACGQVIREYPELAEPHYILGRAYRAVMKEEAALQEQMIAIGLDPSYAPAQYQRVVLEVQSYRESHREETGKDWLGKLLEEINTSSRAKSPPGEGEAPVPETDGKKGEELEQILVRLEDLVGQDETSISDGRLACAWGLLFWIKGEISRARDALLEAIKLEPMLEEAYEALASLEEEDGNFEDAVSWWTKGIEMDGGFVPFRSGRGFTYALWAQKIEQKSEDPREKYREAIADYNFVFDRNPGSQVLSQRGKARFELAIFLAREKEKHDDILRAAFADMDRLVKEYPDSIMARLSRGWDYRKIAYLTHRKEAVIAALRDFGEAIRLDSNRAALFVVRGRFLIDAAQGYLFRNPDPEFFLEAFRMSVADFRRAIQIDSKSGTLYYWLGFSLTHYGTFLVKQREMDPSRYWEDSRDAFSAAIGLIPKWGELWIRRGAVRNHLAEYHAGKGRDPLGIWEKAEADLTRGIELDPDDVAGPWLRGYTYTGRGGYLKKQGGDPRQDYEKGILDFKRACEMDPRMKKKLDRTIRDYEKRIEMFKE